MSKKYEFNPKMYQTVAQNIRRIRKEKGMSLEELSKYAELKQEF